MPTVVKTTARRLTRCMEPSKLPVESSDTGRNDALSERLKAILHPQIGRELRTAWRVLTLGPGCCELASYLSKTYSQRVTGVAVPSKQLRRQEGQNQQVPVRCVRGDADRLCYFICDKSKDAAVVLSALSEMKPTISVLRKVYDVLRPGGEMLLMDFVRDQQNPQLSHEHDLNPEQAKARLVQAGFRDIEVRLEEDSQVISVRGFRPALSP